MYVCPARNFDTVGWRFQVAYGGLLHGAAPSIVALVGMRTSLPAPAARRLAVRRHSGSLLTRWMRLKLPAPVLQKRSASPGAETHAHTAAAAPSASYRGAPPRGSSLRESLRLASHSPRARPAPERGHERPPLRRRLGGGTAAAGRAFSCGDRTERRALNRRQHSRPSQDVDRKPLCTTAGTPALYITCHAAGGARAARLCQLPHTATQVGTAVATPSELRWLRAPSAAARGRDRPARSRSCVTLRLLFLLLDSCSSCAEQQAAALLTPRQRLLQRPRRLPRVTAKVASGDAVGG
eukprot:358487-Chlamydomonas_euryale.AAC.11